MTIWPNYFTPLTLFCGAFSSGATPSATILADVARSTICAVDQPTWQGVWRRSHGRHTLNVWHHSEGRHTPTYVWRMSPPQPDIFFFLLFLFARNCRRWPLLLRPLHQIQIHHGFHRSGWPFRSPSIPQGIPLRFRSIHPRFARI
jgi:hypothetical protein